MPLIPDAPRARQLSLSFSIGSVVFAAASLHFLFKSSSCLWVAAIAESSALNVTRSKVVQGAKRVLYSNTIRSKPSRMRTTPSASNWAEVLYSLDCTSSLIVAASLTAYIYGGNSKGRANNYWWSRFICSVYQVGIIGGSGLHDPDILQNKTTKKVDTPYGKVLTIWLVTLWRLRLPTSSFRQPH